MKLNNQLDRLKSSEAFKYLLKQNPLYIFLSGSTTQGLRDERSDIDLCIIVEDFIVSEDYSLIGEEDEYIHWYYHKEEFLLGETFYNNHENVLRSLDLSGASQLHNLSREHFIYIREDISERDIELFINKARTNARGNMLKLINNQKKTIEKALTLGLYVEETKTKFLYHLCWISHVLEGTEINKEYCLEIKRIRWVSASEESRKYCIERLMYIKENFLKEEN